MFAFLRHTSFGGKRLSLTLFTISFPVLLVSQELQVKGTLKKDGSIFKEEAEILLYERNEVVGKTEPNWLSSFSFKLSLDAHYTIEVRAEGHISKRVSFDTRIPEDVKDANPSRFEFDVVMLEKRRVPEDEAGIFDFPVGRVFFDPYEKEFRFNDSYTSRIRREFRKVLNEDTRDLGKAGEKEE